MVEIYKIFHELFQLIYHFQVLIWIFGGFKILMFVLQGIQAMVMASNFSGFSNFDVSEQPGQEDGDKYHLL